MTTIPRHTYTTLQRSLRHDIPPMRLYHKAKKLGTWDPRAIDLMKDRQDWLNMPQKKREALRNLLVGFQAGEEAVTLDLLPLLMTVAREGRLEEEMYLTTFLWEEAKHTEFFRRIFDEVLEEPGALVEQKASSDTGGRNLFTEDLTHDMHILLTDPSPVNQVRASIIYNMIIEGVFAETGYYSFSRMLSQEKIMPGLMEGIQLIKRDESRHIAYGVFFISRHVAQDKSLWPVVEARMHELYDRARNNRSDQPPTPEQEEIRNFAYQQFQKRLNRIAKAREQTLEDVYQIANIEEEAN
uniref:Ribonucleotide-diphosphate reductase n=1 Tax=Thermosporothrix sp. COM3 TaxID=2490863 RepID=A0A455SDP6_9CHLR|nr:ribonucleotide-diphosphate reductase [Thermosporothrix sp. COM3]